LRQFKHLAYFSLFDENASQGSKTTDILTKSHWNVFGVKKLTQISEFDDLRKSTGLKLELAPTSRNIFEAAPCPE